MINFIKLFIAVVIILIIYLSYVFYNNYKNSKLEDEIVIKSQPEGFKNKEKANLIEIKEEKNLIMKIKKGGSVHNENCYMTILHLLLAKTLDLLQKKVLMVKLITIVYFIEL